MIPNTNLYVLNVWQGDAEALGDGWANDFWYSVIDRAGATMSVLAEDYDGATHATLGPMRDGVHFLVRGKGAVDAIKREAKVDGYRVSSRRAWAGNYGDGQGHTVTVRTTATRKRTVKRNTPRKPTARRARKRARR
jgi:hypothetical protein